MKAKYVQILCDIAARGNRQPFSQKNNIWVCLKMVYIPSMAFL